MQCHHRNIRGRDSKSHCKFQNRNIDVHLTFLAFCVVDRDIAIKDEGIKLALDAIERLASTQNVVQDGKTKIIS